ncbi:hypothetical protein DXG01_001300 [Tephrocybe rancida]|nr:hypothetical protein DXG01_001300 [Tephrocybe rancida]
MEQDDSNVDELLQRAQRIATEARFVISSLPNAEETAIQYSLRQLRAVYSILTHLDDPYISEANLSDMKDHVMSLITPLEEHYQTPNVHHSAVTELQDGQPGRLRQIIDLEQAQTLHNLGASWTRVAEAMGTTRQTLFNHLREAGLTTARPAYSEISDDELDEEVAAISLDHPLGGSTIIHGHLRFLDIHVPIERVKESLQRVDAIGVLLRWNGVICRRVYKVQGSNALWHMDGNEKLRPWGFYVYGCIDGHSRLVIYLRCSNNKRSRTMESVFKGGVEVYGWPSRVQADFGTENNRVEVIMIDKWGAAHRAYLRGRSIHNVRIERLWRDVRRYALEFFRQIFLHLEQSGLLDMEEPAHRIVLYLVYEPQVQKQLDKTVASWNFHKLRTARNLTPIALWELSRQDAITQGYWTGDPGDHADKVDELYGVDSQENGLGEPDTGGEGPWVEPNGSLEEEREAGLFINEDEELAWARDILKDINLTRDDGNEGIDVFCQAKLVLETFL